jgi:hypothetical protein
MLLKETIAYYTSNDSSVFCVFLDATKAFDRMNYFKLFRKLIGRNVPAIVCRFLLNSYLFQSTKVNWNGVNSSSFKVLNGVRQGGVLSPVLFCIYLDGLLDRLRDSNLGCYIGLNFVGALAYADDLTLLAPSAHAIRKMIDICTDYAKEFNIIFNANKSKCIVFDSQHSSHLCRDFNYAFYVEGKPIEIVSKWPHLGNFIECNQSDIMFRRGKLIGQINDVLSFFGTLDSVTKSELLYRFCGSIYGSVLWDLSNFAIIVFAQLGDLH